MCGERLNGLLYQLKNSGTALFHVAKLSTATINKLTNAGHFPSSIFIYYTSCPKSLNFGSLKLADVSLTGLQNIFGPLETTPLTSLSPVISVALAIRIPTWKRAIGAISSILDGNESRFLEEQLFIFELRTITPYELIEL